MKIKTAKYLFIFQSCNSDQIKLISLSAVLRYSDQKTPTVRIQASICQIFRCKQRSSTGVHPVWINKLQKFLSIDSDAGSKRERLREQCRNHFPFMRIYEDICVRRNKIHLNNPRYTKLLSC